MTLNDASSTQSIDIQIGKDGWIFLVGGANNVLDYYTRPNAFSELVVQDWIRLLRERSLRAGKLSASYYHIVVPEKLSVYYDMFEGDLPFRSKTPVVRLPTAAYESGLQDCIVSILPFLLEQKANHKLFWQTDTHWTFEGCLCAYQVLINHLGLNMPSAIREGVSLRALIELDLGSKMNPPRKEEFVTHNFLRGARRVSSNSLVAFKERMKRENEAGLHVGSKVVFCNWDVNAVNKTVLIFGDSFSEYRPHLLTGMLAETFQEVHFIWSSSIDWNYVETLKPDIIITESAERFAGVVPSDTFDLERYVVKRLASLMNEHL